ncbi:hypothetical protein [Hominenteromicrobium sp.]|uniref:hypothetical protein n=1 Tax=Hominenteromicrobium sp. TaxID=3073581 RepID=UPI00399A1C45
MLTVLIVLLLLMVINGMLILHDAHSLRVSMRVRPGGQQGKDVNLNITVNSDKKLLTAGQYTASLKPLEGRIGTTAIGCDCRRQITACILPVSGGTRCVEHLPSRSNDLAFCAEGDAYG